MNEQWPARNCSWAILGRCTYNEPPRLIIDAELVEGVSRTCREIARGGLANLCN
uniref:Uncharacterized protein n=1 Tax=Knipowitschia caucasica TaxID=637954 RepID=A0AAV2LCW6_KNICA